MLQASLYNFWRIGVWHGWECVLVVFAQSDSSRLKVEDLCSVSLLLVNPDLCKNSNYVKQIEFAPLNPQYISCREWGQLYKWEHKCSNFKAVLTSLPVKPR
jgi:hypothetical protein